MKIHSSDIIQRIKEEIEVAIKNNRIEKALQLISLAAIILYDTNQCYKDDYLEKKIEVISKIIKPIQSNKMNKDTIIFYDGFGLDQRGLAQIYIKSLVKIKNVVYVTNIDASKRIPTILNILKDHKVFFLRGNKNLNKIRQLAKIIEKSHASSFFFYSRPHDVVGTVILNSYKGKRFQINLTDHAFWLGSRCIDTCIEFRDYGASISAQYRNIDNLVKIPFYPVIDYKTRFQGFPFDARQKKVIFSGGNLYKTFSSDRLYYRIVDYILSSHEDVVFWYAGSGDKSQINKIIEKYPQRAFLTTERSDLYQVLSHCYFYLSTYPICGGLMFQYSAVAGKVPITLKFDDISDGFLLNQNEMNVEFNSYKEVIAEIDHLLNDEKYALERGEAMRKSVIDEQTFDIEVNKLFNGENYSFPIKIEEKDTLLFRKTYSDRISDNFINEILVQKNNYIAMSVFPVRFIKGCLIKLRKKAGI